MSLETSEKMGRGRGEAPVEVMLLFDGGEDVGKFDRRDVLPDTLEVRVNFRSVAIDPETVDNKLAMVVVINHVVQISLFLMRKPWPLSKCTRYSWRVTSMYALSSTVRFGSSSQMTP
jgi:hypothetical protein